MQQHIRKSSSIAIVIASMFFAVAFGGVAQAQTPAYEWRYYRPSNTGIQGDYCDAIWIGPDDDP
jgi:hypothetical protein